MKNNVYEDELPDMLEKHKELIDTLQEVLEILNAGPEELVQDAARRVVKERDEAYEKAARQCYITKDSDANSMNHIYYESRHNLAELFQMRIRALKGTK